MIPRFNPIIAAWVRSLVIRNLLIGISGGINRNTVPQGSDGYSQVACRAGTACRFRNDGPQVTLISVVEKRATLIWRAARLCGSRSAATIKN